MSETPSDKEPDAAQLEDWYWADGRDDVTLVSSTAHVEGLRAVFNAGRASVTPLPSVDDLAQIIRYVDGDHKLGAGALAEKIHAVLSPFAVPPTESEGK